MEHQIRMMEIARERPRYGFWLQPGLGKTAGSLAIIDDQPLKTVVVCPKAVMEDAWIADAERLFAHLNIVCCWASNKKKRLELIRSDADILVINIDLFKNHVKELREVGVERLILDESSMIKSHKAKRTAAAIEFADEMKSVYLLSGTPAPNCPTEYFTQMRAIGMEVFGRSFYGFAARFFYKQTRPINGRDVIVGYIPRKDRQEEFSEKLGAHSWSLSKKDALDLPPQTDIIRVVDLDTKDRATYEMTYAGLAAEMNGEILSPAGQAKVMKMRQLSGGFYYEGDHTLLTNGQPKLTELMRILEELGSEPVVIWAHFRAEIDSISKVLSEMGKEYGILDGRTKDSEKIISDFQEGKLGALICHPAASGHGITLTAASYAIYYSMDFSYERYQQSRDRIHRKGQENPCTYYHIVADRTVDEGILWCVRNKAKMSDALLRMIKSAN